MKFPNAQKGITKIIIASIIIIVASVIIEIFSFAWEMSKQVASNPSTNAANNVASASQANPNGIRSLFLMVLIGSFIIIVGIVIQVIGLWQSGKDEKFFKYALYAVAVNFFGVYFIRLIPDGPNHMIDYAYCGTTLVSLVYSIFVVQAIINLAKKQNDTVIEKKGTFIFELTIVVYLLMFILRVAGIVVRDNAAKGTKTLIEAGVVLVSVIGFFIILSLLLNAKKMLTVQNEQE